MYQRAIYAVINILNQIFFCFCISCMGAMMHSLMPNPNNITVRFVILGTLHGIPPKKERQVLCLHMNVRTFTLYIS